VHEIFLMLALGIIPHSSARFVLTAGGLPLSVLEISLKDATFSYSSTRLLEEGVPTKSVILEFQSHKPPETWALLHPPAIGCRTVVEELSGHDEALCVTKKTKTSVEGTVAGSVFVANYRNGELHELKVGGATFVRTEAMPTPLANPYLEGFAVTGAGPVLEFSKRTAFQAVDVSALGVADDSERPNSSARCLTLARQFLKSHLTAQVVLGLLVFEHRAFAHAWVELADGQQVDPSWNEPGPHAKYLRLPEAGSTYLQLLSGTLQLRRKAH
jgi:hypothetical protein